MPGYPGVLEATFLGLVQGLTEFLPVSSSGHLVIFQDLMGIEEAGLTLDVLLHTGTLAAVIIVFRRDILNLLKGFFATFAGGSENAYKKTAWMIILASIPAGLAGIFFKDRIEHLFTDSGYAYFFLIITGLILFTGKFFRREKTDLIHITALAAFVIGIAQMTAILPGISRSGATITAALIMGVNREDAARFSFLLMLPAVAGATFLEMMDITGTGLSYTPLIAGFAVSVLSGYAAIKLLMGIIRKYKLHYFAYYCITVGVLGLVFIK